MLLVGLKGLWLIGSVMTGPESAPTELTKG